MHLKYRRRRALSKRTVLLFILLFVMLSGLLWSKNDFSDNGSSESFSQLIKESNNTIDQDDPRLIRIIQNEFLYPPSIKKYSLGLYNVGKAASSDWTVTEFNKLIPNKKNGFFIECGAFDGTHSNTINFERHSGWSGLLIEPDPIFFKSLLSGNRKSWLVKACLSHTKHPSEVNFQRNGWGSAIESFSKQDEKNEFVIVQCLPLYSILLAINVTKIDYFSLDVEGVESQVLMTIPWDKVNISVIAIEIQFLKKDGVTEITEFMANWGYKSIFRRIEILFYHPELLF